MDEQDDLTWKELMFESDPMIEPEEDMRVCPYCNGTDLDLDGDSGGGCTHCFNGYVRE
jgi:hypothetical protein